MLNALRATIESAFEPTTHGERGASVEAHAHPHTAEDEELRLF